MNSTIKLFGKRIKELRKSNNYKQEQLAEILGVDYQTISRIETGYYFTSYDNLEKLAKAFNVEIKDLFDFKHLQELKILKENLQTNIENLSEQKIQKLVKFINEIL